MNLHPSIRIGLGYDSHRFAPDRALRLGGVTIPGSPGLAGHSDADVLIHAIVDAMLGAAALGDIGGHFPDDDPRWRNADSRAMLRAVAKEISDAGYAIINLDATVICERPRLRPHIGDIRASLAAILDMPVDRVSVKGKTNEGMDATGEGLGVAVHCVVLLGARETA